jgi:asparagine synthase (glutamine-hydrolysing)
MCGFFGVVAPRNLTAADFRLVERGTDLLRHRGPDDEGYVALSANQAAHELRGSDSIVECSPMPHIASANPQGESVLLGARRLAILDLSAAGHMPMHDGQGNWVVFNGEIYNHVELRGELAACGHRFRSACDTEVLLHGYRQWGVECLDRFNGMWAFALWDASRQQLFCSRDRFGEKQLYHCSAGDGTFWFASEIAPLRLATRGKEPVNEGLVWDFLMYGLADHTEETFFTGIQQLLPGTYLTLTFGESVNVRRYYDLKAKRNGDSRESASAAQHLRERLYESVRLRLRSDVPVASLLSGGLDSASVVAAVNRILPSLNGDAPCKVLRTYTNAYPQGHPYDESPRVREALQRFPSVEPVFVQASVDSFRRDLLTLVALQEQPFHNASIFAGFNLLGRIRRGDGIKVVLTGEAGDELLAGYQRVYLPLHFSRMLASWQWVSWTQEASAWGWKTSLQSSAKGFFRKLPGGARMQLQRYRNPVATLLRREFLQAHVHRDEQITSEWRGLDLQDRLIADLTRFNLPQLLRHLDRNAMHWSVETRVPFLDHRLVEFAFSLPDEMKLHRGYSKFILRQAMSAELPGSITWNRAKLGFGMAEQFWLKDCLEIMQDSRKLRDFVDVPELRRRVACGGHVDQAYWLPISLGLWLQTAYSAGN